MAVTKLGKNLKSVLIKPKIDHNINIAGLLVTDADTVNLKAKRADKGTIKGLLYFEKKIPGGSVYILNGAEFPNAEAVDLLLYLLWHVEKNDWNRLVQFKSLNRLVKEVFGVKKHGRAQRDLLEKLLTIWKFHGYYFPDSFIWQGKKITIQFGVIDEWEIISHGRGRPAELNVWFNEKFLDICKNTDWYRRPPWVEIKKLRKELAKSLYLLALDYKQDEKSKRWKIYIDSDLKSWYRNSLNSLADPKHLYPKLIIEKRLKPAIEEINKNTNLRMKFEKTTKGNYCIFVEEVAIPGIEKIEIPFDILAEEDKAILVSYVEAVAKEKKIDNIWGFLRSMTTRQVNIWLKKAREYFSSEIKKKKDKGYSEDIVESSELIENLKIWGKKKYHDKPSLYRLYFGDDKILKAFENEKEIVFVCIDKILAQLLAKSSKEIKEFFGKEVKFVGKEEFKEI